MPRKLTTKRGRPVAEEPLVHNKGVRLTERDYQAFAAEAKRRSEATGVTWSVADYLRHAGRQCIGGPILPGAVEEGDPADCGMLFTPNRGGRTYRCHLGYGHQGPHSSDEP